MLDMDVGWKKNQRDNAKRTAIAKVPLLEAIGRGPPRHRYLQEPAYRLVEISRQEHISYPRQLNVKERSVRQSI